MFYRLAKLNPDEMYYVIRWQNNTALDIIHQKQIQVAPESILVFETYTAEVDGEKRKGTVLLKGHIFRMTS